MPVSPPLTLDAIRSTLATQALGRRIELFQRTASTNRETFSLAQSDAEHGTVVVAEEQTEGRGRLARTWFSPPAVNLYCSILVRRSIPSDRLTSWLSWLPLMTALAAAKAVETIAGIMVAVKWPNDLLIGERKVGGILCQSGTSPQLGSFQIIGIGINVNADRSKFPPDIRDSATTIAHETGHTIDRTQLLSRLLLELEQCLDELALTNYDRIALAYRAKCVTLGKIVRASLADGTEFTGLAQTIGSDGSLHIAQWPIPSGGSPPQTRQLYAADIVHLRPSQTGR